MPSAAWRSCAWPAGSARVLAERGRAVARVVAHVAACVVARIARALPVCSALRQVLQRLAEADGARNSRVRRVGAALEQQARALRHDAVRTQHVLAVSQVHGQIEHISRHHLLAARVDAPIPRDAIIVQRNAA